MRKFGRLALILISAMLMFSACAGEDLGPPPETIGNREMMLSGDFTGSERNRLFIEDLEYLRTELPARHPNAFFSLSKDDYNRMLDELISEVDTLTNPQLYTRIAAIVAALRDGHTLLSYYDGYSYPVRLWISGGEVYIIDADKSLKDIQYSKVLKINGVGAGEAVERVSAVCSYENETLMRTSAANMMNRPIVLRGLGIIEGDKQAEALFTIEKNGVARDVSLKPLVVGTEIELCDGREDTMPIMYSTVNYRYYYLPDDKTFVFEYNACADAQPSMDDFCALMFDTVGKAKPERFVIDLRNNTGGNSSVIEPFTSMLSAFVPANPDVKIYILIGELTFSAGVQAIYQVKEAAADALIIGEPTGGAVACYIDHYTFQLPNSRLTVYYSIKYQNFNTYYSYQNSGKDTFLPEATVVTTIDDLIAGRDPVLEYALNN